MNDKLSTESEQQYECRTCGNGIADIVELIQHGCDTVLTAPDLSSGERSTLMYIESRVVEHRGELDSQQMNYDDQSHIKLFTAAGLLEVDEPERNPDSPREHIEKVTRFTDDAWRLASECRQMRADSWMEERDYDIGNPPGGDDE